MSHLDNLESSLLSSRKVSDFLKAYSPTLWQRVLKASIILGIQSLESAYQGFGLMNLSVKDIEDIVVKNEQLLIEGKSLQGQDQFSNKENQSLNTKASKSQLHPRPERQGQPKQVKPPTQQPTLSSSQPFKNSFKKSAISKNMRSSSLPAQVRGPASKRGGIKPRVLNNPVRSALAAKPVLERKNKLRQSNSESMILERKFKEQQKPLDPRIYPAWWGEDHLESPIHPKHSENFDSNPHLLLMDKQPETSLERDMRKIKETAKVLDANIGRFGAGPEQRNGMILNSQRDQRSRDSKRAATGAFGNSHMPAPPTFEGTGTLQQPSLEEPQRSSRRSKQIEQKQREVQKTQPQGGAGGHHARTPLQRVSSKKEGLSRVATASSKQRLNQYHYNQKEKAHQGKTLPSYLRNVQSKERGLIARDKHNAQAMTVKQQQENMYAQFSRARPAPEPSSQPSKLDQVEIYAPPDPRDPEHRRQVFTSNGPTEDRVEHYEERRNHQSRRPADQQRKGSKQAKRGRPEPSRRWKDEHQRQQDNADLEGTEDYPPVEPEKYEINFHPGEQIPDAYGEGFQEVYPEPGMRRGEYDGQEGYQQEEYPHQPMSNQLESYEGGVKAQPAEVFGGENPYQIYQNQEPSQNGYTYSQDSSEKPRPDSVEKQGFIITQESSQQKPPHFYEDQQQTYPQQPYARQMPPEEDRPEEYDRMQPAEERRVQQQQQRMAYQEFVREQMRKKEAQHQEKERMEKERKEVEKHQMQMAHRQEMERQEYERQEAYRQQMWRAEQEQMMAAHHHEQQLQQQQQHIYRPAPTQPAPQSVALRDPRRTANDFVPQNPQQQPHPLHQQPSSRGVSQEADHRQNSHRQHSQRQDPRLLEPAQPAKAALRYPETRVRQTEEQEEPMEDQTDDNIADNTDEFTKKMKTYIDKAMEVGRRFGLKDESGHKRTASHKVIGQTDDTEENLRKEMLSSHNNKETLTLSGTLSAVNTNFAPGQSQNNLRQSSNIFFDAHPTGHPIDSKSSINDDGELSQESDEDSNRQILRQQNRDRLHDGGRDISATSEELSNSVQRPPNGNTSSELSSPKNEEEYKRMPSQRNPKETRPPQDRYREIDSSSQFLELHHKNYPTEADNLHHRPNQRSNFGASDTQCLSGDQSQQRDYINNTKDLNPMIMMSGEDVASASPSTSQVNITGQTHLNSFALQRGLPSQTRFAPPDDHSPNKSDMMGKIDLSTINRQNPFATQNLGGFTNSSSRIMNHNQSSIGRDPNQWEDGGPPKQIHQPPFAGAGPFYQQAPLQQQPGSQAAMQGYPRPGPPQGHQTKGPQGVPHLQAHQLPPQEEAEQQQYVVAAQEGRAPSFRNMEPQQQQPERARWNRQ